MVSFVRSLAKIGQPWRSLLGRERAPRRRRGLQFDMQSAGHHGPASYQSRAADCRPCGRVDGHSGGMPCCAAANVG